MNRRFPLALFAFTLMLALLTTGPLTLACGPFSLEAVFVFTVHPEYPLSDFAHGDIGVLQPSYARSYLFVAYRYLNGMGFNEKEERTLNELWKERLDYTWELGEQEWIKEWNTARAKVPGVNPPGQIDVYRHREKPNEYETYLNCQKDAFATATETLEARIKKFGADSAVIKEWVAAQDQVFANCSEGQHIPATANESDPLVRADRNYQIAAANFYSGNFDEAGKLFTTIAADPGSPWRDNAPYLAARTLVRKASLGAAEIKQTTLSEAETQLNNILSDKNLAGPHQAAARLLSVVRIRLHPETRLNELARALVAKDRDVKLKQDLWDYTVLLDQFTGEDEAGKKKEPPPVILADDLTDWIVTFEASAPATLDHSLAKWQATHSIPWLIAALTKIDAKHLKTAELVEQAVKIRPDSAAYPTTVFHLVRLDLQAGRMDEARRRLDESLVKYRSSLNASSLNLLLNLRMALAERLGDFLTYAQRLPAGFSWNDDGREIPSELKDDEEVDRSLQGQKLFDLDAAQILNQGMPLAVLKQAAESNTLPAHLRRDLAQAVWLRAVLLEDYQTANELVPTLKALLPDFSSSLDSFAAESQPEAKKFAALYAWLKFPGLEPIVDAGIGRHTALAKQDSYRDNWWCGSAFAPGTSVEGSGNENKAGPLIKMDTNTFPVFLTQTQRAAAAKEHAMLTVLGAAPNYLCRQVVQWSTRNPDDPRVPEALHLAVKTTRYGCTNKETGRWSKAAYDLLHKRYPGSTWAKQTPYWFKD